MSGLSSGQLVTRAAHLADRLRGASPPVERNTLLTLVADFVADPAIEPATLHRLLRQVASGAGGHLQVGQGHAAQVRAAVAALEQELAASDLSPSELRQLLGWTARLLQVRSQAPAPAHQPVPAPPPVTPPPPRPDRREERRPPKPAPRGAALGSVKQEGLSALEALKRKLEGEDKKRR